MKIKSLTTLFFAVGILLCGNVAKASVDFYTLKICRDGKTLELTKTRTSNAPAKTVRFGYNEDISGISQKLSGLGLLQQRTWVYFHCMWGNNRIFQQATLHYIRDIVDNGGNNAVLSVIWPANQVGYKSNWKKAIKKGYRLENFMMALGDKNPYPLNILSHSMGNRVFQGVWQKTGTRLRLENVILASADLDADIFSNDFSQLSVRSKQIVLVQHDRDRMLTASVLIHGKKRLGRKTAVEPKPQNLVVLDATPYASSRLVDMSNHLHFIFADSVRHQLKELAR